MKWWYMDLTNTWMTINLYGDLNDLHHIIILDISWVLPTSWQLEQQSRSTPHFSARRRAPQKRNIRRLHPYNYLRPWECAEYFWPQTTQHILTFRCSLSSPTPARVAASVLPVFAEDPARHKPEAALLVHFNTSNLTHLLAITPPSRVQSRMGDSSSCFTSSEQIETASTSVSGRKGMKRTTYWPTVQAHVLSSGKLPLKSLWVKTLVPWWTQNNQNRW